VTLSSLLVTTRVEGNCFSPFRNLYSLIPLKQTSGRPRQNKTIILKCIRKYSDLRRDSWGSIPGRGKIILYSTESRPTLGSTQPPVQWLPRVLPGSNRPGHVADVFMALCLIMHGDNFTFTFPRSRTGPVAGSCATGRGGGFTNR
jgi:hypothetical protein